MTVKEAVKQSGTPVLFYNGDIRRAQKLLQPGEAVVYAQTVRTSTTEITGPLHSGLFDTPMMAQSYGVVVVTDRRVFYSGAHKGKKDFLEFPLTDILAVDTLYTDAFKLTSGCMHIRSTGQSVTFLGTESIITKLEAAVNRLRGQWVSQTDEAVSFAPAPETSVRICPYCDSRLDDGTRVCPHCGALQEVQQPAPAPKNEPQPELRICPGCGTETRSAFCPKCGQNMNGPVAVPAAPQPQRTQPDAPAWGPVCPRCRSGNVTRKTRGYSLGLGCLGFLLFPFFGLLLGLIGSKKASCTCQSCGHRWKGESGRVKVRIRTR